MIYFDMVVFVYRNQCLFIMKTVVLGVRLVGVLKMKKNNIKAAISNPLLKWLWNTHKLWMCRNTNVDWRHNMFTCYMCSYHYVCLNTSRRVLVVMKQASFLYFNLRRRILENHFSQPKRCECLWSVLVTLSHIVVTISVHIIGPPSKHLYHLGLVWVL